MYKDVRDIINKCRSVYSVKRISNDVRSLDGQFVRHLIGVEYHCNNCEFLDCLSCKLVDDNYHVPCEPDWETNTYLKYLTRENI